MRIDQVGHDLYMSWAWFHTSIPQLLFYPTFLPVEYTGNWSNIPHPIFRPKTHHLWNNVHNTFLCWFRRIAASLETQTGRKWAIVHCVRLLSNIATEPLNVAELMQSFNEVSQPFKIRKYRGWRRNSQANPGSCMDIPHQQIVFC